LLNGSAIWERWEIHPNSVGLQRLSTRVSTMLENYCYEI
jgi:hypothetical protein